jgi:AcrR family transcriptional regulator
VDGRAARWEGHRDRRRQEFVAAALAVIERDGPGVGVDRISAELGVGRQALYRQFVDRADLDRAVAERAADLLVEAVVPHLARADRPRGAGLEEVVRQALDAYVGHVEEHLNTYRFIRAHDSGVVTRVKDTVGGRVAVLVRDLLGGLGPVAAPTADTLAIGVVGLVDAVVGRWLDEPAGTSRSDLVSRLVAMVLGAGRGLVERQVG